MHRERGGQIRFASMLSKRGLRDGLNDDSCSLNEGRKIRSIAEYRLKQQLMERFNYQAARAIQRKTLS
jgi:hypothetical protein